MRFIIGLFSLAATILAASSARAEVRVVATVPDLAAIAKEVGGNEVKVTSMALPTQDAHFVDAKPSLALDLNKADLLLVVGLELEVGWLPVLLTSARNGDIQVGSRGYLDCSTLISPLDIATRQVDRSEGDVHPGGNPHYTVDPRNAAKVAKGIADRLAELDPKHAETYQANAKSFIARLDTARKGWEQRLVAARGTAIVGYHKSWAYLADWLGFVEIGFIEPKPGIPPTPSHVAKLLGLARSKKVKIVLQEQYYPDDTAGLVAKKVPASLIRLPGGTDVKGGQSYIDHLEEIVKKLEAAL
jgi:zinc/manganese transport system substrate-binding protein